MDDQRPEPLPNPFEERRLRRSDWLSCEPIAILMLVPMAAVGALLATIHGIRLAEQLVGKIAKRGRRSQADKPSDDA